MIEIYYIEDDSYIAHTVKDYLSHKNCHVSICATIKEAQKKLQLQVPDLVLVDWNMPDGRGDLLCSWIRSRWSDLPVIFLTVRDDSRDIVTGFHNGADDYVVKPFELEILYSRICALLRRSGKMTGQYLSCGGIRIDQNRMMVFVRDEEILLSQAEYRILLLLMRNKGKTVTRAQLLEEIWDHSGNYVNDNTLTVTIKRLREKLNQPSCLKTIRSFGYRLEEAL